MVMTLLTCGNELVFHGNDLVWGASLVENF